MPGRFPQLNSLGVRQACGEWPNNEQQSTATCPEGTTGDPVTIVVPAGSFYADTIENADELALEDAQEQAEAALQCDDLDYFCPTGIPASMEPAIAPVMYDLTTWFPLFANVVMGGGSLNTMRGAITEDGKKIAVSVYQTGGSVVLVFNAYLIVVNSGAFEDFDPIPTPANTIMSAVNRSYDIVGTRDLGEGIAAGFRMYAPPPYLYAEDPSATAGFTSVAPNPLEASTARVYDNCGTRRLSASVVEEYDGASWVPISVPVPSGLADFVVGALAGNGVTMFATATQAGVPVLVIIGVSETSIVPFGGVTAFNNDVLGCASNGSKCYGADWIWDAVNGVRNITTILAAAGVDPFSSYTVVQFTSSHAMSANGKHILLQCANPSFSQESLAYIKLP